MADNKRYITQAQENGTVMISEDVIATIVTHAVEEVEGIAGLKQKKSWGSRALNILIGEDNSLVIDCSVVVKYGTSVVNVAKNVQAALINAVESMTGVEVTGANVNISGIAQQ